MDKYYFAAIAIILSFLFVVFFISPGIPSFDDYYATLHLIKLYYFESQGFFDRASVLLLRHNEHRILLSRLTAVVYYDLFKELNFYHLILFQNLFLIGFVSLIVYLYKKEKQFDSITFLFMTVFLFSTSFWQVTQFYWGGIQHYTVFFFSFFSLIVLHQTERVLSWRFLAASLLAILAVLSFGNGFLALLMGLVLLFSQKKFSILWPWIVLTIGLLVYCFLVEKPGSMVKPSFNIIWMAKLLFTFLGSFLYVNSPTFHYINIIFCMLVGIGVLGFWLWLSATGYMFRKPLLYVLFSLPVITGIIISISRFETKAAGGIAPRYMFFTASIPVIILLISLDLKLLNKNQLKKGLPFLLLMWVIMFYNNYRCSLDMKVELTGTMEAWKKDKKLPLVYYDHSNSQSDILNWAICNQILKGEHYKGGCEAVDR